MKTIGRKRERDQGFYDWVRLQPEWRCLVTGMAHLLHHQAVERCHIRSRGAGGSDRWIMPLIPEEHKQADTCPAWWYRHRVVVAEWCAGLPELWARYDAEKKTGQA